MSWRIISVDVHITEKKNKNKILKNHIENKVHYNLIHTNPLCYFRDENKKLKEY
jgi:hypothetical protein